MAWTEIYVDPSLDADSGTGTVGDPYGDLEYAIEQEAYDSTNGTRLNIKAGTDEVLAAKLETAFADTSVTAAWAPLITGGQPGVLFQGYTSTAGDGGIGSISGGSTLSIFGDGTIDNTHFVDMKLFTTTTSTPCVNLDNGCTFYNCEISGGTYALTLDVDAVIYNCYVHNSALSAIFTTFDAIISRCYVEDMGTGVTHYGIEANSSDCSVTRCVVVCSSSGGSGIRFSTGAICANNSVYGAGSGGWGIICNTTDSKDLVCINNLVEGFSSVNGTGIDLNITRCTPSIYGGNSVYDCVTNYDDPPNAAIADLGGNESLAASPFVDAANGNFTPVDTGSVKEGTLPEIIGLLP